MNPHQKNKIDINSLSQDEQRLFRLYGKLPNKKDLLQNKLKERKYFDSGDYALSKAGKASDTGVTAIGTEHPSADTIPHASPLHAIVTRSDSISGASGASGASGSPPTTTLTSPTNQTSNPLTADTPTIPGPSPAGMHRGSINGIPGGGLPQMQTGGSGILNSRSPVKESYLNRSSSVDDDEEGEGEEGEGEGEVVSPPAQKSAGIPIRR